MHHAIYVARDWDNSLTFMKKCKTRRRRDEAVVLSADRIPSLAFSPFFVFFLAVLLLHEHPISRGILET